MIDGLVVQLNAEQVEDDNKKRYCEETFEELDDMEQGLELDVSDLVTAIEGANKTVGNLKVEIEALDDGIRVLDI